MEIPIPMAAEQLRRFAQCSVSGSKNLTPIVNDFFAIENGSITGCCALGGALMAVRPDLRTATDLKSEFGQHHNDVIFKSLLEHFPVLGTTAFNDSFIARLDDLDGCPTRVSEIDGINQYNLINVISTVFDVGASVQDIQIALNKVADLVDTSSDDASVH